MPVVNAFQRDNSNISRETISKITDAIVEDMTAWRNRPLDPNAIESLNARFHRAVRHRGHFPNEQAAMKVLYLVATRRRTNRQDLIGRTNGWKTILNTLTIHYGDRIATHIQ